MDSIAILRRRLLRPAASCRESNPRESPWGACRRAIEIYKRMRGPCHRSLICHQWQPLEGRRARGSSAVGSILRGYFNLANSLMIIRRPIEGIEGTKIANDA